MAGYKDFQKLDIRIGKVIKVEDFPEARSPTYKLTIDFGPKIGIKKSSVGAVENHKKEELQGKLVVGVVNLQPKQIGPFMSEVLTLGAVDKNGKCILIMPSKKGAVIGGKVY